MKQRLTLLSPYRSVSTPSAQSTTLCELQARQEYNLWLMATLREVETKCGVKFRVFVDLLATNGCRVSEVLSIHSRDIQFNGLVFVKGLKGSKNRMLATLLSSQYLVSQLSSNSLVFDGYNRFYVYRELKKLGLFFTSENSTKFSITHAFRHFFIRELRKAGFCDADIAQVVGQVNPNNTALYGKEKTR